MSRSSKSDEDLVIAKAVPIEEIPVIDFTPFREGGMVGRLKVATAIADACREIGFFYLSGHGVPEEKLKKVFEQSAEFFHQPLATRAEVAATPERYRGWIPMPHSEPMSRSSRLFEQYRIQAEFGGDGPLQGDDRLFYAPNRWPAQLPEFQAACSEYYDAMLALSRDLLRAFALGLGLPEERFDGYFDKPLCQLSLLYYIPLPDDVEVEVSNTVSHTDEGPLTILAQDNIGGLEVKRRDGSWISAPPIPGAYTINVGDMMMWWSNGRYLSNYHRVRNKSKRERFSIPFFLNPDKEAEVRPLPEFVAIDGKANYEGAVVGEHLKRFYTTLEKDPRELDR